MKHSILTASLKASAFILFFLLFAQCSTFQVQKSDSDDISQINEEEKEEYVYEIPLIHTGGNLPVSEFGEIWAYVVAGSESALTRGLPLSDIGYFGAEIDAYGSLTDVPRRQNLTFQGKVHLVVACNSRSLTHFVLIGDRPERKTLIADLAAATRNYDGLQIDFENVPARDGNAFLSFLTELRAAIPGKIFTIALPARTRKIADDVYDYEKIKPIVDRILVMAYDEHWSGSNPGSVASMDWCRRVADYSIRAIGPEKLIMGLPFYGRAWGDYSPSRALINRTIQGIIRDEKVAEVKYENGIPVFTYHKNVSIKVYFEDEKSLTARMAMYKSMNVGSIGFWRLGQETPEVWKYLKLSPK